MKNAEVGLTVTYNRMRDPEWAEPEVVRLRELTVAMDRAVLDAYGWGDLAVPPYAAPVTEGEKRAVGGFEDEVIDRLFALNAARAEGKV